MHQERHQGYPRLDDPEVAEIVADALPPEEYAGRRVLLIVPDATRTAPVGRMFAAIFERIGAQVRQLDVLVALGTHPPLSEEAICRRLDMTAEQRRSRFASVRFFNHEWDNPAALKSVGVLSAAEVSQLTAGRFSLDVPVEINRLVYEYDCTIILGPVFPHEVVGFSGGNKYLFPGVSGARILNMFHWLGALCTNAAIIGNALTPVRAVVDRAASMVRVDKRCFAMVVAPDGSLAGLFFGSPEEAWSSATELSRRIHVTYVKRTFQTVLSCAPAMYGDLWVAGKCMYKLEPVVADGGELIIYAPHVRELSVTHGKLIEEIGYHCRDYFLNDWNRFQHRPWGVLAHSTHVRGAGTLVDGVERCRIRVTLATGIPEATCRQVNLGYRDPASVRPEDFANREEQGVLLVPRAGETLFRLEPPDVG